MNGSIYIVLKISCDNAASSLFSIYRRHESAATYYHNSKHEDSFDFLKSSLVHWSNSWVLAEGDTDSSMEIKISCCSEFICSHVYISHLLFSLLYNWKIDHSQILRCLGLALIMVCSYYKCLYLPKKLKTNIKWKPRHCFIFSVHIFASTENLQKSQNTCWLLQ